MKSQSHAYHKQAENAVDVSSARSLVDVLRLRARLQAHQRPYTFLADGESQATSSVSYGELDRQARTLAVALQSRNLQGERAILLYPPGLAYITAFFGCLYAGVIAVPAYPPGNKRHLPRLQAVINDSQAAIILCTETIAGSARSLFEGQKSPPILNTDALTDKPDAWQPPELLHDALAFLQYTSGSTGNAKGVMVSHANLMNNQKIIKESFDHDRYSTVVGWLPLYHDMGLIGNVIQPLYIGAQAILMPPMAFLEKPVRWIKAISDYRAHTSGGPNFAFDHCVQKITPEEKAGLDLSSWRLAFNGSEPVQAATLERFAKAFAGCGFDRKAFYPCYGLAEATLLVTGAAKKTMPTVKSFNKSRLEAHQVSKESAQSGDCRELVGCGAAGAGHRLRIADPDTGNVCDTRRIGEIQVSGPSVTQGYWQKTAETAETFFTDDDKTVWLRTGDLGFIDGGELFVSGRLKDLIIVRGRNYYPHDIESAAEATADSLNPGCLAAFAVNGEDGEKLVLLAELKRSHFRQSDYKAEFVAIRRHLADECGVQADVIVLLKPGAIFRTTSGKIRRTACREAYESGLLDAVAIDELNRFTSLAAPAPREEKQLSLSEQRFLRRALLLAPQDEAVQLLTQYLGERASALSGLKVNQACLCDKETSLLSLGIDSLKATELKYFIDDFLDIDLPVVSLLEDRSISAIAEQVLSLAKRQDGPKPEPSDQEASEMTLSLGQQAIWTVCRMEPDTTVYNMPIALHIRSTIDCAALDSALRDLMERHEQLQASFRLGNAMMPVQMRVQLSAPLLERVACQTEQEKAQQLSAGVRRPFDLEHGPLLRTLLLSTAEDDHILLFCAHHIAVDFRSLAILLDELKRLYAAHTAGLRAELPFLAAGYADYINWQKAYLRSDQAGQDLNYWRAKMGGDLPKLALPADRPRGSEVSCRGSAETLTIDPQITQKLRQLTASQGVTLYMLLLALFKVLLYRYSGQQDIIVGSPTLGRPKREFAGLVGYFVNPVALRSQPAGSKTFTDYLAEVKQTVLEALAHQDYPFSLLVEHMQPERGVGLSPFYRAWFVLQDSTAEDPAALVLGLNDKALDWPGLAVQTQVLEEQIAQFDLTLVMAETGAGLSASFQYNLAAFETATIRRMTDHFQCLLHGVLADPAMRLAELPLLTPAERSRQLVEWNETHADYPQDACLHELFETQAAKTPQATAVVFQDKSLSYEQLNTEANRLAHNLRSRGVGPEMRVGICLERSLELLIGLLAVLKAGAAYMPIDPDYPKERQLYLLKDADIGFLLTRSGLVDVIAYGETEIICLDRRDTYYLDYNAQNPAPAAAALNTAYVIYTSGSTGNPKGVMVSHRNVVHSTWARLRYYEEPVGCYLLLSSFAFDSSVAGIFWTLSQGGCLCLPEDNQPKDPVRLGALIDRHQVTHLLALPSLYAAMLEHIPAAKLASLKAVIVAGEACPDKVIGLHGASLPEVSLFNEYGPTEATVWSSVYAIWGQESDVAIGKPIDNMRIYILDRHLQPVPVGVIGELYIGGEGITPGYLKQPGLTAEKFLPDPFGEAGGRLYKTGDLARYRFDGHIEFCGRIDDQTKLRGYRIELGEIETRLLQQPGIREAAVLIREDQPGNQRLVAYLVSGGESLDTAVVRARLKESLPDYMVPSAFVPLEALPLNANGKLDRKALPAPEQQSLQQSELVAPRDEAEEAVAGIWREILGVEQLGIHDDFFELGGHSLSGVQVMAKMQELFGIDVPVNILFEAPTLAEFVDRVAAYQAE
jgi:amino acid adenylation domain-containing protein